MHNIRRLNSTYLRFIVLIILVVVMLAILSTKINEDSRLINELATLPRISIRNEQLTQGYVATHVEKGCSPNLKTAKYYSQSREDYALFNTYFNSPNICRGVYVEIGALDGVRYSNTKFFEDALNWTGVLIEAQPQNAQKLAKNRPGRNNVILSEAVCPEGQTHVDFAGNSAVGGIVDQMTSGHIKHFFKGNVSSHIKVPCRPIGAMLRAARIKAIDFFVLDVEGAELMVLETMDWTIPVKVFVIEMGRGDRDQLLIDLLRTQGYHNSTWDITTFCLPHHDCADNMVFEHSNYTY